MITRKPKRTSYINSFLLKKKGSRIAVNNEEVAKQTTATDMVETFIDSKKHNQWIETKTPTTKMPKKSFLFMENNCFLNAKNTDSVIKAISILYHTRWIVSKVINLPRIPVNPNNRTIIWSELSLYFAINGYTINEFDKFVQ